MESHPSTLKTSLPSSQLFSVHFIDIGPDLGGIVCDYDKLFSVVEKKKALFSPLQGDSLGARIQQAIGRVLIFSDAAHALGASRNGKMAGEIADFTDFSFHAVNLLFIKGENMAKTA